MEKVKGRDHFGAPGQARAADSLSECRQAYDEFARLVFAQESGRGREAENDPPGRPANAQASSRRKER
jgi:hypothetical protein